MDRADDKSTELELDPDLVGHDPELADAVESIRQAVPSEGRKPRASRTAASDEVRAEDTIRIATVGPSNDDASAVTPGKPNHGGARHVLNVPSGFLTRALPLYWPAPAPGTESRRRYAMFAVLIVFALSFGLCVIAYLRGSSTVGVTPSAATSREPSTQRALPAVASEAVANPRTDTEYMPPTAAELPDPEGHSSQQTAQQMGTQPPSEQPHRVASATKSVERVVRAPADPQPVTPPPSASSVTARKSWFEVR
jgi:hypothetical protein